MPSPIDYIFKEIDPLAPPQNSELIIGSNNNAIWKEQQGNFNKPVIKIDDNYYLKISDNVDEIFDNLNELAAIIKEEYLQLEKYNNVIKIDDNIAFIVQIPLKVFRNEHYVSSFLEKGIYVCTDPDLFPQITSLKIKNIVTNELYLDWHFKKEDLISINPIDPIFYDSMIFDLKNDGKLYYQNSNIQFPKKILGIPINLKNLNFIICDKTSYTYYKPIGISGSGETIYYFDKTGTIKSISLSTE